MFKKILNNFVKKFGYEVIPSYTLDLKRVPLGTSNEKKEKIQRLDKFTMLSYRSISVLIDSVEYVVNNKIPGDIIQCGVGQGGSVMTIAQTLVDLGNYEKNIFLYDTFEGFPEPTKDDINFRNEQASTIKQRELDKGVTWGLVANMEQVKENVFSTKYSKEKFNFIKGKVENTIPTQIPEQISILHLDTDFYESTKHELIHLYPRLSKNGILIIDDYGHWSGSKKAVDEYFKDKPKPFFHTISNNGDIIAVKNH
tara:strand:+ start:1433 stop:2194 length:762 start_codon:yes stop_codon:yes gene_type:complete